MYRAAFLPHAVMIFDALVEDFLMPL